jgi:hypothetical protein
MKRVSSTSIVILGVFIGGVVACGVACGSSDDGNSGGVKPDTGSQVDSGIVTDSGGGGTDSGSPTDTGGDGFTGPPPCPDPTTVKEGKLADFNDPASGKTGAKGDAIHVQVVATSIKFIVSKSKKSLKCLYGVFAADANATFAPYSGILVVSQGNNGTIGPTGSVQCSEGDLIPTDIKAGDLLDLTGTYDIFGPSATTCGAGTPPVPPPTPATAPQLTQICKLTRTAGGTVPTPADVTPADLVGGADTVLKWSGGLVKISGVKAKTATAPGDSSFGAFTLDPSGLQITDTIYYRGAATAPNVKVGDTFTAIIGQSYLDFCTWSLAPRGLCDFNPEPIGDAGGLDGGGPGCP